MIAKLIIGKSNVDLLSSPLIMVNMPRQARSDPYIVGESVLVRSEISASQKIIIEVIILHLVALQLCPEIVRRLGKSYL